MKHIARKRFGQHFLTDPAVVGAIIEAADPQPGDRMVEIGPGLGVLTRPLLARLRSLDVIELDRDLVGRLRHEFSSRRLRVHAADALRFDFAEIGNNLRIIGNLPYNISTPLLFHLANSADAVRDAHFMLQKEVVERMVARPSTPAYGRLSVMLQCRFAMELLFTVPAQAFQPAPKVESAVVRMEPLAKPAVAARDEKQFAQIVTAAFSQRRKTLRNTLKLYFSVAEMSALEIDAGLRAENLSVGDYAVLANAYVARRTISASE